MAPTTDILIREKILPSSRVYKDINAGITFVAALTHAFLHPATDVEGLPPERRLSEGGGNKNLNSCCGDCGFTPTRWMGRRGLATVLEDL